MTDCKSDCVKKCLEKQERLKTSGDYLTKMCVQCSSLFYVSKYSNAKHCCACRVNIRNENKRLARLNRVHPIEGFPRDQFQERNEMLEYLKGDGVSKIQCLMCGHWYGRLAMHLQKAHEMEVREYKIKFGIPFRGYGLIGQNVREYCSRAGKRMTAELTPEQKLENVERMAKAMKEKGIKKNITPYYHRELANQAVTASKKYLDDVIGKRAIAPCSRCGTETEVSLIASVASACILLCGECKKLAVKERAKKCYEGSKLDKERWNRYLDRMRMFRKKKREQNKEGNA